MARETVPIPSIARSAFQLLSQQANQSVDRLAGEALGVMALAPELGWKIDFDAGVAVRDVPDEIPAVEDAP